MELLSALRNCPHNLTRLAKKLKLSPQEVRRYLVKLSDMGFVKKNDGEYTLSIMGEFFLQVYNIINRNFRSLQLLSINNAFIPCLNCLDPHSKPGHGKNLEEMWRELNASMKCNGLCPIFMMMAQTIEGYFNVTYFVYRVVTSSKQYLKIAIRGAEMFPLFYPSKIKLYILLDSKQKNLTPIVNSEYGYNIINVRIYEGVLPLNVVVNEKEALLMPVNSVGSPLGDVAFLFHHPHMKDSCERLFDYYYNISTYVYNSV